MTKLQQKFQNLDQKNRNYGNKSKFLVKFSKKFQ